MNATSPKTPAPPLSKENKEALVKQATYASVSVAFVLIGLKTTGWIATGSISLLSTLLDSFLDAGASILNLFAVRHALQPPTKHYRFGHGKAEALAALGQSLFIIGSAIFLVIEAYQHFESPEPIQQTGVGVSLVAVSTIITGLLVWYQRRVLAKTKSLAITADSLHYLSDVLLNMGVILSLLGTHYFGWLWLDPTFGFCIAFYVLYTAIKIVIEPIQVLMDRELDEQSRDKIATIVMQHKDSKGFHKLKTRSAGPHSFIQMHLDLDKNLTLQQAHAIADCIEKELEAAFPGAEVIIHQDPV